jgi:hypothetical protein
MLTYADVSKRQCQSVYHFLTQVSLYVCRHTAVFVSACCYMCPDTAIYVSSHCYICVLILLDVSAYCCVCVRMLLYMRQLCASIRGVFTVSIRQHTSAYVSACCYICGSCARVFAAFSPSLPHDFYDSYYCILYIRVRILLHMCSCARLSAAFSPWRASWPRSLTKASTWSRRRNLASSVNLSQL